MRPPMRAGAWEESASPRAASVGSRSLRAVLVVALLRAVSVVASLRAVSREQLALLPEVSVEALLPEVSREQPALLQAVSPEQPALLLEASAVSASRTPASMRALPTIPILRKRRHAASGAGGRARSLMPARSVRIGLTLTDTPLARQHRRELEKGPTRRLRPIPWTKFRRDAYPAPALALAEHEMSSLAIGEYTAVDQFARVASALTLNGAPLDLVACAARIPSDEVRHADYALRFASMLAGHELTLPLTPPPYLRNFEKPVSLEQLDVLMVELPTIGETLAAALLTACAERAVDPVARGVLSSILSDEVHHLRLGWYYFAWRAPQWSRADQQRVADFAASVIVDVERQFWLGRDAPAGSKRAATELGVLDSVTQRKVVRKVMLDEIVPGLDAFGLGASHAWKVRNRGKG